MNLLNPHNVWLLQECGQCPTTHRHIQTVGYHKGEMEFHGTKVKIIVQCMRLVNMLKCNIYTFIKPKFIILKSL